MLKQRIITALILVPLVIAGLFKLSPDYFAVLSLALCMLAAWEWALLAGFERKPTRVAIAVICGMGLGASLWAIPVQDASLLLDNLFVRSALVIAPVWWLLALGMVLCYPASARWWHNAKRLKVLFGLLTLVPFFWGLIVLRMYAYSVDSTFGAVWILYVLFLIWGADSGAYFSGKRFGKHKLAPKVSPGKTWEGVIGGLATSALIAVIFDHYSPLQASTHSLIISSIIAVAVSVLGDLTESMFKREAGVKDSGQIMPGHGGVLDRIDSLTAAIPVFACLLLLVF
ncbi:MAG: phosphatidate cytidylyltransferase [Plesiomonas sp.]